MATDNTAPALSAHHHDGVAPHPVPARADGAPAVVMGWLICGLYGITVLPSWWLPPAPACTRLPLWTGVLCVGPGPRTALMGMGIASAVLPFVLRRWLHVIVTPDRLTIITGCVRVFDMHTRLQLEKRPHIKALREEEAERHRQQRDEQWGYLMPVPRPRLYRASSQIVLRYEQQYVPLCDVYGEEAAEMVHARLATLITLMQAPDIALSWEDWLLVCNPGAARASRRARETQRAS